VLDEDELELLDVELDEDELELLDDVVDVEVPVAACVMSRSLTYPL